MSNQETKQGSQSDSSEAESCEDWSEETKTNTKNLAIWTGAWLVTMAIATFGSLLIWPESQVLKSLTLLLNLLMGVGVIFANKRHLRGLDELQQKIQLEAMALSLGVGLVVGCSYSTMDSINLIAFDAEISHLVMLIGLTYLAGVILGNRRYS